MLDECEADADEQLEIRKQFKPAFKPVEKTKEYVETTYYGMTDPSQSSYHISFGKFWADLASHFVRGKG